MQNYLSCFCNYFLIDFVGEVFIIKITVKENSFKWNLQRDKLLPCWILKKFFLDLRWYIYIYNLTIKRDKVSRRLLIFSIFGSDVPQRSILGPLFFLIHINNLSNDIVALAIKQSYLHAHVCSYISGSSQRF